MSKLITTTLTCAALMALTGCGGGSGDKSTTAKADPAQQAQQDADAKSNARNLVSQIESCYVDYGSYEQCGLAGDGSVDGQDTGLGDAAASLTTETSAQGYLVTSKSDSGNSFSIGKVDGGAIERHCITKGEGGCPASGTW